MNRPVFARRKSCLKVRGEMWEDPLVAEVRRVRKAHAAQYDYDLGAMYKALKAQEAQEFRPEAAFPPRRLGAGR